MAATAEEVRAWARAEGIEGVPARGQVPAWLTDRYEQREGDLDAGNGYVDGAADQAAPPPLEGEGGAGEARAAETAPRNVKAPSGAQRAAGRLRARLRGRGGKPAGGRRRARKRYPRIPVTDMIEEAWGQLAWAAQPIPPLSRVLSVQAPFAGLILEDAVQGTIVDNALQPIVRTEQLSRTVMGMLGPPAFVMAMLAVGRDHPSFGYLHGGLRFSLLSGAKLSNMRLEEVIERTEANKALGEEVDKIIEYIFSMPGQPSQGQPVMQGEVVPPGSTAGEGPMTAEQEAALRMQQVFGRPAPPNGDAAG